MRKYKHLLIGAVFGFVLSIGVGAHAEVVNMIGKVVDGTFAVKVGDTTLDTPAITIEGTSYLPVRSFSDATGYDVNFDANMGITLKPKMYTPATTPQKQQLTLTYYNNLNILNNLIPNAGIGFIEIDGNQYVFPTALSSIYKVSFINNEITFTSNDNKVIINRASSYTTGVDGFMLNGDSLFKLSTFGLKATVNGDTLVIDKQ